MKNQYFGDVKDYIKYGLLRQFAASGLDLGVCWLLTRDDGSNDGNNLKYLEQESWRDLDPELYDFLRATCARPSGRMVSNLEASGLLPARYFSEVIPESESERLSAMERAWQQLTGAHLLFFDPDNGIETRSAAYGGRGSSRYVFWQELEAFWEQGVSLLIYQHFPRQEHGSFAAGSAEALASHTPGSSVFTLTTSTVVYLLAVQRAHLPNLKFALREIDERFRQHVTIEMVSEAPPVPEPSTVPAAAPHQEEPPALLVETAPPKYPISVFWSEANHGWIAQMPDLPSCSALGDTPQSAVEKAVAALDHWVALAREQGTALPAPSEVRDVR